MSHLGLSLIMLPIYVGQIPPPRKKPPLWGVNRHFRTKLPISGEMISAFGTVRHGTLHTTRGHGRCLRAVNTGSAFRATVNMVRVHTGRAVNKVACTEHNEVIYIRRMNTVRIHWCTRRLLSTCEHGPFSRTENTGSVLLAPVNTSHVT